MARRASKIGTAEHTDHYEGGRLAHALDAHWRLGVLVAWLAICGGLVVMRWGGIEQFALSDTDDNLRMAQVRALLDGQGWFDLRQYRLSPPEALDIHWSRLVDLPIAALILLIEPFAGDAAAERWAAALAPLLPLGLGLCSLALIVRRVVAPSAWPIAIAVTLCANLTLLMWSPLRIDHHGWQLALLAVAVAGLVDPERRRGGLTAGIASALSLAIGLEMLIYLASIGGLTTLAWIADRGQAMRLRGYGASLAGGTAIGFLPFASEANRLPVCDALSPVWLSAMLPAGALLVALTLAPFERRRARFAAAALAGIAIAVGFALLWPECLSRPEGASDQLRALWLDNVREAKPITEHGWRMGSRAIALPLIGLVGSLVMLARARGTPRFAAWIAIALLGAMSTALLFWQMRVAPGAQLLAVPGAAGLAWTALGWVLGHRHAPVRLAGGAVGLALILGYFAGVPERLFPQSNTGATALPSRFANARCKRAAAYVPLARLPRGLVLTHVDLGPRLIVLTGHDALAGPYHRNGEAIVAVMTAFEGGDDNALETVRRREIDYVMICPGLGEMRLYARAGPESFAGHLRDGAAPGWLEPIPLPRSSPFLLWRVRPD